MKTFLLTLILVAVFCIAVQADDWPYGIHGIGPRVGVTSDPDQLRFGGQIDLGDIAPNLMLVPNLEIGVGDNVTTTAPTMDLDYRFRSDFEAWAPYVGAGVGPIFYSPRFGNDHTNLGVYVQGGIAKQMSSISPGRFFMEMRAGVANSPDVALTLGWTFGR